MPECLRVTGAPTDSQKQIWLPFFPTLWSLPGFEHPVNKEISLGWKHASDSIARKDIFSAPGIVPVIRII